VQQIEAGTVVAPSSINDQLIYLLYLRGDKSFCQQYLGYHYFAETKAGLQFAFAVLPECDTLDVLTQTVGHEIIEAATDPYITGWYWDYDDAVTAYLLPEVGDLCNIWNTSEAGWSL